MELKHHQEISRDIRKSAEENRARLLSRSNKIHDRLLIRDIIENVLLAAFLFFASMALTANL